MYYNEIRVFFFVFYQCKSTFLISRHLRIVYILRVSLLYFLYHRRHLCNFTFEIEFRYFIIKITTKNCSKLNFFDLLSINVLLVSLIIIKSRMKKFEEALLRINLIYIKEL